jgi:hypothetical protein
MSAWVVSKEHIDVILAAAIAAAEEPFTWAEPLRDVRFFDNEPDELARLGELLLQENVRSVRARYAHKPDVNRMIPSWALEPYVFDDPGFVPTPVEGLRALDCLEYQSSEHRAWETSEAKAFCEALRQRLTMQLPGYKQAPWVWEPDDIARRRKGSAPI